LSLTIQINRDPHEAPILGNDGTLNRLMQRFIAEIKRRRVIPVAAYYLIGAWLACR
jgi:hypothetical protein